MPCIFYCDYDRFPGSLILRPNRELGLSNLAATIVGLLGYEAHEMWDPGILELDAVAAGGTIR